MTKEARQVAKSHRQNTRDTATALAVFLSLAVATIFDFRDDTELLLAFQGALITMLHRAHRGI